MRLLLLLALGLGAQEAPQGEEAPAALDLRDEPGARPFQPAAPPKEPPYTPAPPRPTEPSGEEVPPPHAVRTRPQPPPEPPRPPRPSIPPSGPPPSEVPLSWKDAAKALGKRPVVEGVVEAAVLQKRRLLLHFHKDHPDHFAVVVPRGALWQFPAEPEKYYLGKRILVRGLVTRQGRRPVIILRDRSQLWLVGEALPRQAQQQRQP